MKERKKTEETRRSREREEVKERDGGEGIEASRGRNVFARSSHCAKKT